MWGETWELEEARIRAAYARRRKWVPTHRYSCFNPGNLIIEQELEQHILASLHQFGRTPLHDKQILDVGCGRGYRLGNIIRWGAQPENIFGIDLLEERIREARRLLPPAVALTVGSATDLQLPDCTFDLVLQFTVFSSILDDLMKRKVAQEMVRVLKPGGCVLWYDFHINNPLNPDVRGLKKQEIRDLFPNCDCHFRRLTLIPPVARAVGAVSPTLCRLLSSLRILSTHYLAVIEKASSPQQ
jgi:ubiquinone/menaquinone biosynthesis C-methylase UbiE